MDNEQGQQPVRESLISKAGRASAGMIADLGKGLLNSQGKRPRIVAHTGGIPPISRINTKGSGIKQSMNLELLKPRNLRGRDISGRRIK